jgi:hypothetical protein
VHRITLVSIPYLSQAVRQIAPRGEAVEVNIAEEWQRFSAIRTANVPMSAVQGAFADHLRAGVNEQTLRVAMQEYPVAQRLPLVRVPTLVICPSDDLREQTLRAKSCLSQGSLVELSEYGNSALIAAPLKIAQLTREFLDR